MSAFNFLLANSTFVTGNDTSANVVWKDGVNIRATQTGAGANFIWKATLPGSGLPGWEATFSLTKTTSGMWTIDNILIEGTGGSSNNIAVTGLIDASTGSAPEISNQDTLNVTVQITVSDV